MFAVKIKYKKTRFLFGQNHNGQLKNKEVSKFLVFLKTNIGDRFREPTNFEICKPTKQMGWGKS